MQIIESKHRFRARIKNCEVHWVTLLTVLQTRKLKLRKQRNKSVCLSYCICHYPTTNLVLCRLLEPMSALSSGVAQRLSQGTGAGQVWARFQARPARDGQRRHGIGSGAQFASHALRLAATPPLWEWHLSARHHTEHPLPMPSAEKTVVETRFCLVLHGGGTVSWTILYKCGHC